MNILLVSDSFIVREALENLFQNVLNVLKLKTMQNVNELQREDFIDVDFAFIDIKRECAQKLDLISEAKNIFKNLKVTILDMGKNISIFKKVVDLGIDGYILNIEEKEDFIYSLKKVIKGKKSYAPDLLPSIINTTQRKDIGILTNREQEVLIEVSDGLNNREIAEKLYITECTVKKHVSSILDKLDMRNRKEIIIYARENLLLD